MLNEFIESLSTVTDKYEEMDLLNQWEGRDERVDCLISMLTEYQPKFPSSKIAEFCNDEEMLEWSVSMIAKDFKDKDIEFYNTAHKMSLSSNPKRRLIGMTIMRMFEHVENQTDSTRSLPDNPDDLIHSSDDTLKYFGFKVLRDKWDILKLPEYEDEIHKALNGDNIDLQKVALQVVERTRNDENMDLIEEYKARLRQQEHEPPIRIAYLAKLDAKGDWIEPVVMQEQVVSSPKERSIFAGINSLTEM